MRPAAYPGRRAGRLIGRSLLELFCGIGGCAAALPRGVDVDVVALDQSPVALEVYRHNHPHEARACHLAAVRSLPAADTWWLSPPCQPYTAKGRRRDLDDPRAASLVRVIALLEESPPRELGLENVPGFEGSRAHRQLRETLDRAGFAVAEHVLCPTELGVPNRRRRFFLVASRDGAPGSLVRHAVGRPLSGYLDPAPAADLELAPEVVARYRHALDVVDPSAPGAIAACFASGYGRSIVRSGSYVARGGGRVRRFSPREVLRLLHFPAGFDFPASVDRRRAWALAGNSLSVPAVRAVLATLPTFGAALSPPAGPRSRTS